MNQRTTLQDWRVYSHPTHFGKDARLAVGIIAALKMIYREKGRQLVMRKTRGSVLIQSGAFLTSEMIEEAFAVANLPLKSGKRLANRHMLGWSFARN